MKSRRKYELRSRAERMQETRRRIVEATVELHSTVGPARTTIAEVAGRAGVGRPTVYSHFPDERSLFQACSSYVLATDPPPDSSRWRRIPDPEIRVGTALAEVYSYYARNGTLLAGARLDGAVPIGGGVSLELGGQVPCRLEPATGDWPAPPVAVELAGERVLAPLGPLLFRATNGSGAWQLDDARDGADRFVVLRTPPGAPRLYRESYLLGERIELCVGDRLSDARGGPIRIAVPEAQP